MMRERPAYPRRPTKRASWVKALGSVAVAELRCLRDVPVGTTPAGIGDITDNKVEPGNAEAPAAPPAETQGKKSTEHDPAVSPPAVLGSQRSAENDASKDASEISDEVSAATSEPPGSEKCSALVVGDEKCAYDHPASMEVPGPAPDYNDRFEDIFANTGRTAQCKPELDQEINTRVISLAGICAAGDRPLYVVE